MLRRTIPALIALLLLAAPQNGTAQTADEANAQSLLSAFVSYTVLRLVSIQKSLEILAATPAARSLRWKRMAPLFRGYQQSDGGLIVWYVRPDGSYFTVEDGKVNKTLSDRSYFKPLFSGQKIDGTLVVSKSTGHRSVIVAVPMKRNGKVIGAIGASVFLVDLADQVNAALDLPADISFFALAPNGLTALHRKTNREFLDPRDLGSPTLKKAANEMLTHPSGITSYQFDNVIKKAVFRTSDVTHWKFAVVFQ